MLVSDTRTVPRVLDSDKAKLFCTREEIKQWRREHGSCVDYLDYCTQVLASRSTDDRPRGTARYRGARTGASPLLEETRQRPWRELPSRPDYGGG